MADRVPGRGAVQHGGRHGGCHWAEECDGRDCELYPVRSGRHGVQRLYRERNRAGGHDKILAVYRQRPALPEKVQRCHKAVEHDTDHLCDDKRRRHWQEPGGRRHRDGERGAGQRGGRPERRDAAAAGGGRRGCGGGLFGRNGKPDRRGDAGAKGPEAGLCGGVQQPAVGVQQRGKRDLRLQAGRRDQLELLCWAGDRQLHRERGQRRAVYRRGSAAGVCAVF